MLKDESKNYQNYILLLLIICGPIKGLFNQFILDIDITMFAFLIAGVDFVFNIIKRPKLPLRTVKYAFLLLGIFLLMLVSLMYTSSSIYAKTKFFTFIPVLFCFIYPMIIKSFNWKLFLNSIYYIIIPLSLWFVYYRYFYWSPENAKGRVLDHSFYDLLGSYLGLGYLLALSVFIFIVKKKYLISALVLLLMLALGARGPLIFCIITVLVVYFKQILFWFSNFKFSKRKLANFSIFILGLIVIFIYKFKFITEKLYLYGFDRFISLFSSESTDVSASKRIEVMSFALENTFNSPMSILFGNGIGSFGMDFTGEDIKYTPHNIFLEAWYELGIFGFVLISIFLLKPFFIKRNKIFLCFILFSLLDCLKSNNLSGIWILAILYSIYITNPKFRPNM